MIKTTREVMFGIIDPVHDRVVAMTLSKEAAEALIEKVKFIGVTIEKVQVVITRV